MEFSSVGGFVETKPLVYNGKVIFGAWDTFLYALNANDGSLAWKWTNGNAGVLYSPAACWPVAANGKIFIVGPDRFMTAIDAETGNTVWRSKRYQVRECVGISEDGQRVYARCMTDTVVAFHLPLRRRQRCGLLRAGMAMILILQCRSSETAGSCLVRRTAWCMDSMRPRKGPVDPPGWCHRRQHTDDRGQPSPARIRS